MAQIRAGINTVPPPPPPPTPHHPPHPHYLPKAKRFSLPKADTAPSPCLPKADTAQGRYSPMSSQGRYSPYLPKADTSPCLPKANTAPSTCLPKADTPPCLPKADVFLRSWHFCRRQYLRDCLMLTAEARPKPSQQVKSSPGEFLMQRRKNGPFLMSKVSRVRRPKAMLGCVLTRGHS